MEEIKFYYKTSTFKNLLGVFLFGAMTATLVHKAITNDRGLTINHIIELSPNSAAFFYWAGAIILSSVTLFGLWGIFAGKSLKKEIILTDHEISAPKSVISKKIVTIKYSDITGLNIQTVQKSKFLNIIHNGGKLTIPNSQLSNDDFKKILEIITSKVSHRLR